MPHPEADTGSFGLCWGEKERIVLECASLTTRTMASHNSETPTFVGNPVSGAQANNNGNMSPVLAG